MDAITFTIIMLIFCSMFVGLMLGWLLSVIREKESQYEPDIDLNERFTEVRDDQV